MKVHTLIQVQDLPISREAAWEFFSKASNLDSITPPDVGFELVGDHSAAIHECQILRYRIRIAPLVWVNWITEIKGVVAGRSFVDEQRSGPYAFWHHRHTFESIEGGVRMADLIHYAVPGAFIGDLVHPFLVRPKLERIFEFRRAELARRFGSIV